MVLQPYYEFREEMVERLRRELLGPSSEDESSTDRPAEKYIVGVLFPQMGTDPDGMELGEYEAEGLPASERSPADDYNELTDDYDDAVAMSNVKYPSSFGLSFAVDTKIASRLRIHVEAARYERREEGDAVVWHRVPLNAEPVVFDVSNPTSERKSLANDGSQIDGLQLYLRARAPRAGRVSCTVAVINTNRSSFERDERNEKAFFQPVIRVTTENNAPAFVDRRYAVTSADPELRSYELLYRHAREFAIGHGCSVHWEEAPDGSEGVSEIRTEFIPTYELALADSNPDIPAEGLSMKELARNSRSDVSSALDRLCDGYEKWIEALEKQVDTSELGHLTDVAREHVELCRDALERMRAGVKLLQTDDTVWRAFRLMNLAMLQQRARTDWHRQGRPETGVKLTTAQRWRPFQIAFILLCLRGIAWPEHDDRKITDLLWFPTGGGKTEAYLGLIAFTVFLRRLKNPANGGVTAFMRYTLRLLTIQQFQRATLLICACEDVRRKMKSEFDLGDEPIAVGLWLGSDATPNTRKQAKESLEQLRQGLTVTQKNPKQIEECPWCGAPLDVNRNYYQHQETGRLVIACRTPDCEFRDGLPLYLVDEDVYDAKPTLVIATADKFATMPWRPDSKAIFNAGSPFSPPELIIQDELHLISGPLGTLAGLYESAVTNLCTVNGIGPKIIASTATIRRANDQVLALFGTRDMRQFPPPGIDARDSYFAVEAPKNTKGTRRYVGVMAPSTSHTTLLVRTYASLLHSGENVAGSDEVRDHYWTLVGYFGSLRVLGGASMQVRDDVALRLELLANSLSEEKRSADTILELTSNVPGPEIPNNLRAVEVNYHDEELKAVDVVLATNMISVGVDVDRLGLMAVMGQPQSTSEYIQATSRVGRRFPGLVVTMYNAARSRDRSHYESFRSFHQAMYRQVESTSVTPFSARARDRALHAALISLVRLSIPELAANHAARLVVDYEDDVRRLIDVIVERVRAVAPEEAEASKVQLDQILASWLRLAAQLPELVYEDAENITRSLMVSAADDRPRQHAALPTMWSLRDVDKESGLYYVSERMD